MSDELRPALTPEEWVQVNEDLGEGRGPLTAVTISYTDGDLRTGYRLSNPFPPEVLVALINNSLADDHPNKITQADVVLLRRAMDAGRIGEVSPEVRYADRPLYFGEVQDMRRLIAKIAALLPPEAKP